VCMYNPAHTNAHDHPLAAKETYNPRWYPTGNCHTCHTSHTLALERDAEYGLARRSFLPLKPRANGERAQSLKTYFRSIRETDLPHRTRLFLSHSHQHYSSECTFVVHGEVTYHTYQYRQEEIGAPSAASSLGGPFCSTRDITTCITRASTNTVVAQG